MVEKETSLGLICTPNVSASEIHLVKKVVMIFLQQIRLEMFNIGTSLRALKAAVPGSPDFLPVLSEQSPLSYLLFLKF